MKGLWTWVGDKIESIKTSVTQTYSFVASTINSVTSIPSLQNFAHSFSIKWWEGFTRLLDPTNVTKMFHSKKTRQALKESFKANVIFYLSLAMLAELTRETIVNATSSGTDESWLSVSNMLSMLVNTSLGTIMLHRYYDNTLINLALSKSVVVENPISNCYKHCGCDGGALITAGLFSSVNLTGKQISLWAISYWPMIKYIVPVGSAFACGESLAEYPYSSVGVCTKHRAEALIKDNAYSFGIGCSLYGVGELISYLIYWQTGLSSFFISNAVYAAIYPYFITSVLLREKPIPGDKQGMDFFCYHRYLLQNISAEMGKQIVPLLEQKKNTEKWQNKFEQVIEYRSVKFLKWALSHDIYGDWRSLNGIKTNPSTTLFFNEYYHLIKAQLDNLIEMRDVSYLGKIVPALPDSLTRLMLSENYRTLIRIGFDKSLDCPLKISRKTLESINRAQIIAQEEAQTKVIIYDKKKYRESLAWQDVSTLHEPIVQLPKAQLGDKKSDKPSVQLKPHLHEDEVVPEPKQILSTSGSKEISTMGLFSPAVQKPSGRKVLQRKSKTLASFIRDDYDADSNPKIKEVRKSNAQGLGPS